MERRLTLGRDEPLHLLRTAMIVVVPWCIFFAFFAIPPGGRRGGREGAQVVTAAIGVMVLVLARRITPRAFTFECTEFGGLKITDMTGNLCIPFPDIVSVESGRPIVLLGRSYASVEIRTRGKRHVIGPIAAEDREVMMKIQQIRQLCSCEAKRISSRL